MQRNKKILLVSHCILNQNTVIKGEARSFGAIPTALDWIQKEGLGVIQLPCPEFTFLGLERPSMTYEEYDNKEYRQHCRKILLPVIEQLKEYIKCGYQMTGILGIQSSPSCDMTKGVFMEELKELFIEHQITITTEWFLPDHKNPNFNSKEHYIKRE
ncbi:CD3072 family TudS-related putative desulfidase [Cytobacillus sp.]|uniref:CD3072 family TudS-related putative desulfidase n=1 Tax=Cytobacillus sp. TaxID=2675269 RepID=UPI0028BE9AB3|nr:CD3072 family TudS-related putative desulfidase [Cytobacillus sp.]